MIAKAPLERLTAFARDRGWKNFRLLSSAGNDFKRDYHAEAEDGSQVPLMAVFHRDADGVRHFWSSEMLFLIPNRARTRATPAQWSRCGT